jgi:hypothetical protein
MLSYMTPEQTCVAAIAAIGGPTKVGALFDPPLTSQAVSQWKVIPPRRARVVIAAARSLGADVTIENACPQVFREAA